MKKTDTTGGIRQHSSCKYLENQSDFSSVRKIVGSFGITAIQNQKQLFLPDM